MTPTPLSPRAPLAAPAPTAPAPAPAPAPRSPAPSAADRAPTWALVLAGIAVVTLAGNRAGVAALGWIAPVPLTLAATRLRDVRGRALLFLGCVAAMSLQTLKLVGGPASPAFALAFGMPIGALLWVVLALWDAVQRRAGPAWGIHAFAALTALGDVAGFALTPGGHWAASAASQAENLPLMQVASLGGLGLVGLVLAYPAGAATMLLLAPPGRRPWRSAAAAVAVALLALAWGTLRLDRQDLGPTVRVAAVTVDFPAELRSMQDLRGNLDTLFARSELAARRGAQLVAWNEVATLVDPAEEPALEARAAALARRHGIDSVIAYGVVAGREPLLVENVLRWFGPDGVPLSGTGKHFLPPGEPSIAGVEPLRVLDRPWGRAAGAICYDYDSPALARQHARGRRRPRRPPVIGLARHRPAAHVDGARACDRGRLLAPARDEGGDDGGVRSLRPGAREPLRVGAERAGDARDRANPPGADALRPRG